MKKNRVFLFLGILLILYAIYNIVLLQVSDQNISENEKLINQAGYAPLLAAEDEIDSSSRSTENIPDRIIIPKINLDAPVEIAQAVTTEIEGKEYVQYLVPEKFAAGFHVNSAPLGEIGNTVISGHHNAYGEVFAKLYLLEAGDILDLYSKDKLFEYVVSNVMILEEKDQPLDVRLENARWILPSDDERVTLVTCWPHESNTHRLIVVAVPASSIRPTESQEVCGEEEMKNSTNNYFIAYLKVEYFTQYASEGTTDYRQIIMNLYSIQEDVRAFDQNNCQPLLKSDLINYIKARMLQTGFDQVDYQGEEIIQLTTLLKSYQSILESYFQTYTATSREELMESFQGSIHFVPSTIATTMTARNTEEKSLNIREKATSNSRFLGSLGSGTSTVFIGKSQDGKWLLIPFKDGLGWINLAYTEMNLSVEMIPEVLNQIILQEE